MSTIFTYFNYIRPICLYIASSFDDLIILRSISKSFYNNIMQDRGSGDVWRSAIPKIDKNIHFRLSKMLQRSIARSPNENYFIIWTILTRDADLLYRRPCAKEVLLIIILATRDTAALRLYLTHIDSFDGTFIPCSYEIGPKNTPCQRICTHDNDGYDRSYVSLEEYVRTSWGFGNNSDLETIEQKLSQDSCVSLLCEKSAKLRREFIGMTLGCQYQFIGCNLEITEKMLEYFVKCGWTDCDDDNHDLRDWMFNKIRTNGSCNIIKLMLKYSVNFEEYFWGITKSSFSHM